MVLHRLVPPLTLENICNIFATSLSVRAELDEDALKVEELKLDSFSYSGNPSQDPQGRALIALQNHSGQLK